VIEGFATKEGTKNFADNCKLVKKSNFKKFNDLTLSNVGVGTYLGNSDDDTDNLVTEAIKSSIKMGINVIDSAINYRFQRAERSVGKAVSQLIQEGNLKRDGIFVSTKNGYVTNDGERNEDFWAYVNKEFVTTGIIGSNDISSGYHCMTVPFLDDQLERSRKNLQLDCIDLIYLHNPVEGQIQDISKKQLMENLKSVFKFYEKQRKLGKIKFYGLATWECFRVPKDHKQFLSLKDVLNLASEVGGLDHGFRFIQLPYNLYLDQAVMIKNQPLIDTTGTILDAASQNKIGVFTSVPLMQGKLLQPGVLPEFGNLNPVLRAIQFCRSTPGVLAPLIGHKTKDHTQENLEIMKIDPISESEFKELVRQLTS